VAGGLVEEEPIVLGLGPFVHHLEPDFVPVLAEHRPVQIEDVNAQSLLVEADEPP
jgi:hypothetical protein